jgi:hypothetical protein
LGLDGLHSFLLSAVRPACCTDGRDGVGGDRSCHSDVAFMPHKANAARRHHIPRPKRRVINWSEYNEALRQRGSLTVWFTEDAIAAWKAAPRTTPGGQPHYSDLAITTALTLRAVFRLPLRQTEGLIGSILQLLGLDLPVPEPVRASAAPHHRRGDPPAGRQFRAEAGWSGWLRNTAPAGGDRGASCISASTR